MYLEIEKNIFAIKGVLSTLPSSTSSSGFSTLAIKTQGYRFFDTYSLLHKWVSETNDLVNEWIKKDDFIPLWKSLSKNQQLSVCEFSESAYTALRHKIDFDFTEDLRTVKNLTKIIANQEKNKNLNSAVKELKFSFPSTGVSEVNNMVKRKFDKELTVYIKEKFPSLNENAKPANFFSQLEFVVLLSLLEKHNKTDNKSIKFLNDIVLPKSALEDIFSLYNTASGDGVNYHLYHYEKSRFDYFEEIDKKIAPLIEKRNINNSLEESIESNRTILKI